MDNNFENNEVFNTQEKNGDESKLGLISMILAIASVVVCCCGPVNTILAIAAIVLAIVERNKLGKFSTMGKVGLIVGIAYLVMTVISGLFGFFGSFFTSFLSILETNYHF